VTLVRGCLHVRFGERIAIGERIALYICVQLPAQGGLQFQFRSIFPEMCSQAVIIGERWIIEAPNILYAYRARNRTKICTQNRTHIDGP
jgi:hypothetical protein